MLGKIKQKKDNILNFYLKFFVVGLIILFFDQITKFFARRIQEPTDLIFFQFNLVKNTGSAFGIFRGENLIIALISILIIILVGVYLFFLIKNYSKFKIIKNSQTYEFYLLSCIFWAAASNLFDRLFFGFVTDFIDFRFFPVFNIADATLSVCVLILFFVLFKKEIN